MKISADMSGLSFAQPWWLALGLLLCVTTALLYRKFDRRRDVDLAKLAHPRFLPVLFRGDSPERRRFKRALWLTTVFLLFTALSRPQWGEEYREVKRRGIDLLFALDTSHSMLADDLSPNRLDRARMGILDFIGRLEGDRIGLLPFAGSAYALCPLTLDYDAFRESLQVVNTQMIPHQGTDLASAIREAGRLFEENQNNQRILVLITDGEDLQGDVLEAAKEASDQGMVIYTVGVGDPAGATIPIQYQNGRRDFMRDAKGEVVRTRLDETTLKKIAEVSRGLYVPLGRGAEGLNTIYQEKLRLMPKTDMNQRMERIPLERFSWPLALAVLLWLVDFFLPERKRSSVIATRIIMPLLLLWSCMPMQAAETIVVTYNRGTEAYQRGEYADAISSLREALRTPDLSLQQQTYYNLGNALYRMGQATLEKEPKETIEQWKQSIKAYDDALALRADDDDARYNRDLVKKKLEQLQQQQPQNQKSEEQEKQEQQEKEQKEKDQEQQNQSSQDSSEQEKKGEESSEKKNEEQGQDESEQQASSTKEGQEGKEQEASPNKEGDQDKQGSPQQAREMTAQEAQQLLDSLRHEERRVIPIPQRRDGKTDNTTKGKTW
jgi:Ca-activated chloride channel family protein